MLLLLCMCVSPAARVLPESNPTRNRVGVSKQNWEESLKNPNLVISGCKHSFRTVSDQIDESKIHLIPPAPLFQISNQNLEVVVSLDCGKTGLNLWLPTLQNMPEAGQGVPFSSRLLYKLNSRLVTVWVQHRFRFTV
jgi:hypothetical protein